MKAENERNGEASAQLHAGRRERLRRRFSDGGLAGFTDAEALELLLGFAIPRRETGSIAQALLSRFGDYKGVMEASEQELLGVSGIGPGTALLIRLTAESGRRYRLSTRSEGTVIRSADDAGMFLLPLFSYLRRETAYLVCLDSRSRVIAVHPLADPSAPGAEIGSVDLTPRAVLTLALADHACSIILAHNHLTGSAKPSGEDVSSTLALRQILETVSIQLLDHFIISDESWLSMKAGGYI